MKVIAYETADNNSMDITVCRNEENETINISETVLKGFVDKIISTVMLYPVVPIGHITDGTCTISYPEFIFAASTDVNVIVADGESGNFIAVPVQEFYFEALKRVGTDKVNLNYSSSMANMMNRNPYTPPTLATVFNPQPNMFNPNLSFPTFMPEESQKGMSMQEEDYVPLEKLSSKSKKSSKKDSGGLEHIQMPDFGKF